MDLGFSNRYKTLIEKFPKLDEVIENDHPNPLRRILECFMAFIKSGYCERQQSIDVSQTFCNQSRHTNCHTRLIARSILNSILWLIRLELYQSNVQIISTNLHVKAYILPFLLHINLLLQLLININSPSANR